MKNVLDIIYNYSINKKLLDKNAIKTIIKIIIENNNMELIDKINIITHTYSNLNDKTLAYYYNGDINIYLGKIYKFLEIYSLNNFIDNESLTEEEKYLLNNLFILRIIIHELEHSMHEQIAYHDVINSVEKGLIKIEMDYINDINISYFDDKKRYKMLKNNYKKLYDISLIERLADIKSHEKIIDMLEEEKDFQRMYEYEEQLLLNSKLSTYKKFNDMPTIRFFIGIDKLKDALKYDLYGLNFEDRFKFGLNLSYDEYNQSILKLKKKVIE